MTADSQSIFSELHRLWAHISNRRRLQLLSLCGLMLLGTLTEIASLGMVLPFLGALTSIERIFEHQWVRPIVATLNLTSPGQLLLPITLLFGFSAILSGASRLALLWSQTRLGHAIGNDLGSEAYRRTLYQPYTVHAGRNSSEVVAMLMNKINTIVYFIIIPLLTLITSTLIVVTVVMFMFVVDPMLTTVTIAGFGCLYVIVAYSTKKRLAQDGRRVAIEQSHVAQVVQESLGGIRDVLIDGLQESYARLYCQSDNRLRRSLANNTIISGAPRPVIEAFGTVLIGFIAYVLTRREEGIVTVLPILGALALAAQRLLPLVQQGYAGWASMLGGKAALSDVLSFLDQPMPAHAMENLPTPMPFSRQIELDEVYFSYSSQESWVLSGINLIIPRGSRVGFIGTTGSGKSTLLDIVMGLLAPKSGKLCIDGTVVDEANYRAWQAHIAHVPQTIYLTDATIAENIAFGLASNQIDHTRVRWAAQQARIANDIESWEEGYGTSVGESGVRLSGGQRQRIGIARALHKQADVFVFDEATSALDNDTEREVMDSIESLGKEFTVLIVAHRLSTLKTCDQIVELERGRVLRVGTYQNMIEQPHNLSLTSSTP